MSGDRDFVREIIALVEGGNVERAIVRLAEVEGRAFLEGRRVFAGEVGYSRDRLAGGDRHGAVAVLARLVEKASA